MRKHCRKHTIKTWIIALMGSAGLLTTPLVFATDCSQGNIVLSTQQAVDDFQATYGGGGTCDTVIGGLFLQDVSFIPTNITNLNGLSALKQIGGSLVIFRAPGLTSLQGLNSMESIGDSVNITSTEVSSLAGLESLTSLRSLTVQSNESLATLQGLGPVAGLEWFSITFNPALQNLVGFPPVTNLSTLQIAYNNGLTSLDGMQSLVSVESNFILNSNPLITSLDGLSGLVSLNWFQIFGMNSLVNLDGLSSLNSISGLISINANDRLQNIDRLSGAVGEQTNGFYIRLNPRLPDLDAFTDLLSVDGDVIITDNDMLASCSGLTTLLDDIDDGSAGPGPGEDGIPDVSGSISISGNLPGCNSIDDILDDKVLFTVSKSFSDGSQAEVEATLTCNTGLPLTQSARVSPNDRVVFVVTQVPGDQMDCELTESSAVDGYTPEFFNGHEYSETSCTFENAVPGGYACFIENKADDASFTATMDWIISGDQTLPLQEKTPVTIWCDAEIRGGSYAQGVDQWYLAANLADGESLTASVSTGSGPAICRAEQIIAESGVDSSDDCGPRSLSAGGSDDCRFVNTVFYEGVPTFGRSGTGLLILLMLVLGTIAIRRI